jgi:hypothetical protein
MLKSFCLQDKSMGIQFSRTLRKFTNSIADAFSVKTFETRINAF